MKNSSFEKLFDLVRWNESPLDGWDHVEAHQQRCEKSECDGIEIQ